MKWYRIIPQLVAVVLLIGCAGFRSTRELEISPVDKVNEVRDLLSVLRAKNDSLRNFKGIGNIKISQKGRFYLDQRVAWIGEKPARLSIAVLVSGYPAIKLATDGEWLYYLEIHGAETEFKKIRASDPSLKAITSIPISTSDVVMLLAGCIPMPAFDSVAFIQEEATKGFVLVLKEKWWGIRQKIFYDENQSRVYRIDVFQRSGALLYRADIERIQRVAGYEVPLQLKLSTADGNDMQLDIDRCWVNTELPPSAFVLTPQQ
jgi:hypothetical protein